MAGATGQADVQKFIAAIEAATQKAARPSGKGFLMHCPAHEDQHASLSVGIGDDGRILLKCQAGCETEAILKAVGFEWSNLFPGGKAKPPASRARPRASRKVWPSLSIAEAEFAKLPLAQDDAGALEAFAREYGLRSEWVPETWRILSQNESRAVVYPGRDPEGNLVAYKAKGLSRDARGKRPCWFLYGQGGALCLYRDETNVPLLIACGEEKALAAWAAGYHALSPLTGEKPLDAVWIKALCETPRPTILCNDADPAGEKANAGTARALEEAGFPCERLWVIDWPKDAPAGWDLNDVLKAGGPDGVRDLLKSACPWKSRLPRVMAAVDFLAAQRDPLRFHIGGRLPYLGTLTMSAPTKWGKSMWAIQVGFTLGGGDCEWLGLRFGPPARVLYFQAEIADPLLEARVRAILRSMPPEIDRDRAQRNFYIQEIAEKRPNLYHEAGRKIAEALIARWRPQVIILDPLAGICPGMEENAAESMSLVLDYFSNLTVRFGCAVILVHHHGKAGFSRGSSVFEAWPESDLQASFVQCGNETNREVAKVEMRLRCQYMSGPVFWQMPSEENLWFQKMPDDWIPTLGGNKKADIVHVVTVLRAEGNPLSWKNLVARVRDLTDCSESTAIRVIKNAREAEQVKLANGVYLLP